MQSNNFTLMEKEMKKAYERPRTRAIELQQRHVLASSSRSAQGENFGWDEDD